MCAPINIFGPDAINGAGADFAFVDITNSAILTQQQLLATLAGDTAEFFELPGGVISSGSPVRPSPDLSFQDPAIEVYEGFGELRAHLLADMKFVDLLEVNGAIRCSVWLVRRPSACWPILAQPRGMLSGLSVITDYYDIEIAGAVGSLTGLQIAAACVDLPSTDNQFCRQITRNPVNGLIENFTAGNLNLGSLAVRGIDFAATYTFDVPFGPDLGSIDLSLTGTHFLEDTQIFDATGGAQFASITDPVAKAVALKSAAVDNDNLGEFGSANGQVTVTDDSTFVPLAQRDTGDSLVSDFYASYDFAEKFSLYGGINNAFDREPYLGSLVRPVGVRGQFFYVGLRGKF